MPAATAVLVTLIVYKLLMLAIGFAAQRWTKDESDFLLGGRKLGPLVAAISASASSSSVWTLLGVSGYAYKYGASAVWLVPACVGGFALNWYLIAPRLRQLSVAQNSLTLTEVLAGPRDRPGRGLVVGLATAMILVSLVVYVASQFDGASKLLQEILGTGEAGSGAGAPSRAVTILIGAGIVVAYTLLGGFWAVSVTDTLQGLMMAATALALPIAALVQVGGIGELLAGIERVGPDFASPLGEFGGAAAIGMIAGILGIGLGYPGQPHVVNRFMALRDPTSIVRARRYAMTWAFVVYIGMIIVGLTGRVLVADAPDAERVFFTLTTQLFSPVVGGIMVAAVLAAIMSTADSQLLVAASSLSHDLGQRDQASALRRSRLAVLGLSVVAVLVALWSETAIFKRVLFAWSAMGAAFGPLLVLTLWRGAVPARASAATMLVGFGASVLTYWIAESLGREMRFVDRVLPYALAFVTAWVATWRGRGFGPRGA